MEVLNFVIGKSKILFLLRNAYFIIPPDSYRDYNSYDVIGANVVKPSSEGPSLLATLVCKTLATLVALAKQFALVK